MVVTSEVHIVRLYTCISVAFDHPNLAIACIIKWGVNYETKLQHFKKIVVFSGC